MRRFSSAFALLALASIGCRDKTEVAPATTKTQSALLDKKQASVDVEPAPNASAMPSLAAALGPSKTDATKTRTHAAAAVAGQLVDIPAGTFASGSTPGDEGREPAVEPALVDVTMNAFSIDALPYPNDPTKKIVTGVSQAEAGQMCAAKGERLCTELEWERACKGPDGDMFATGDAWDATCDASSTSCASGFGVRGMGTLPEHTQSTFAASESFVVRGSRSNAAGTDIVAAKRCAFRGKMDPATARNVGFRCCKGEPSTQAIAQIEPHTGFKKTKIDAQTFSKIVSEVPELSRIGTDIKFYDPSDVKNVTGRSGASSEGITFVTQPIQWSPETGTDLLVATGHGKNMSFVVALYPLPHEKYRIASYFLLLNDLQPVALAYEPSNRKQLLWSECWGCAGEQGAINVREDHKVMIVQY